MKNDVSLSYWNVIKEQCIVLVKSGFLPSSIKTVEQAIAIALKGHELGLPIMASFTLIDIIQGRPTLKPEGMLALIYKNCPGSIINFIKFEENECIIEACRPGHKMHTFKFDETDAKAAGLISKSNWKQYPRAMYRSRTVAEMARTLFPDVIMGCSYTKEELMPDLPVNMTEEIPLPTMQPVFIEDSKKEEPKKSFDKNNKKHVEKINNILKEKNVSEELFKKIHDKMQGRPSSDIDLVLDEVASEIFTKDLQPLKDEEIPFYCPPETKTQEASNV